MKKITEKQPITTDVETLMKLMGGPKVSVSPSIVRFLGCPSAAIMLAQSLFYQFSCEYPQLYMDSDGLKWFFAPCAKWEKDTGLVKRQQMSARKILKSTGFWLEKREKAPAGSTAQSAMYFHVDANVFVEKYNEYEKSLVTACKKRRLDLSEQHFDEGAMIELIEGDTMEFEMGNGGKVRNLYFTKKDGVKCEICTLPAGVKYGKRTLLGGGKVPNPHFTYIYIESIDIESNKKDSLFPENKFSEARRPEIEENKNPTTRSKKTKQDSAPGAGPGGSAAKNTKPPKFAADWPGWTKEVSTLFDEIQKQKSGSAYVPYNWQAGAVQNFNSLSLMRKAIETDIRHSGQAITIQGLQDSFRALFENAYDWLADIAKSKGQQVYFTPVTIYRSYNNIKGYAKHKQSTTAAKTTDAFGNRFDDEKFDRIRERANAILNGAGG